MPASRGAGRPVLRAAVPAGNGANETALLMNDDFILAWVYRDACASTIDGPLSGVTFGVKDNIDVCGMPTGFGLTDRPARIAAIDAWCVAALRAAGAIPVGKTHSTALASRDPAVTRNPRLDERTPGGSSAGSAAAVAAGHVPFALGTQTLGSVLRPASFCGVVGFEPTYGVIPVNGVAPMAPSFDTVGIIAENVATTRRAAGVLVPLPSASLRTSPLVLGWAPDAFAACFSPAVRALLAAHVAGLDPAQFMMRPVALERPLEAMRDIVATVMAFEAHAVLAPFRATGPLPPGIHALIAHGSAIAYAAYRDALHVRDRLREEMRTLLAPFDAVLVPIANEPPSRETTGDPLPQAPWTAWGMPALALPVGALASGAPVAIGIVAPAGADATVLDVAQRLEQARFAALAKPQAT